MSERDQLMRQMAPVQALKGLAPTGEEQPLEPVPPVARAELPSAPADGSEENSSQMNGEEPIARLATQPRGMLDRSLQAQLGRQLRAIFSDVAQEPVPDRFVKLLDALAAKEKRR